MKFITDPLSNCYTNKPIHSRSEKIINQMNLSFSLQLSNINYSREILLNKILILMIKRFLCNTEFFRPQCKNYKNGQKINTNSNVIAEQNICLKIRRKIFKIILLLDEIETLNKCSENSTHFFSKVSEIIQVQILRWFAIIRKIVYDLIFVNKFSKIN